MVLRSHHQKTNKKGQDKYELFLLSCFALSQREKKKKKKEKVQCF